jgi:hypothetical protein
VRADGDSDAARHKECQDITAVGAAVNVALAVAKVRSLRSLPWSVGSPLASLASLARRLLTPWRCTPPACVYRPWGLQSRGEHPRPSLRCVGACWMQVRCLGWLACPHAQPGTPPVGCHQLTNSSSSLSLSLSRMAEAPPRGAGGRGVGVGLTSFNRGRSSFIVRPAVGWCYSVHHGPVAPPARRHATVRLRPHRGASPRPRPTPHRTLIYVTGSKWKGLTGRTQLRC